MLAIDQYGHRYHIPGVHPRSELCLTLRKAGLCGNHPKVSIMFHDKADGSTVRVGYVIAGLWLALYTPYEVPA
jgi:hypothetical protein